MAAGSSSFAFSFHALAIALFRLYRTNVTSEQTKWYWISRAPMIVGLSVGLWLIFMFNATFLAFIVAGAGMFLKMMLDPEQKGMS